MALRVSTFALALLLAGAEPEELATGVAASLRHVPGVADTLLMIAYAFVSVALGVTVFGRLRDTLAEAI